MMEMMEKKLAEAYLLGAYLGDGHCQVRTVRRPFNYQFMMPSTDPDLLVKVRSCIHQCFPQSADRVSIKKYHANDRAEHLFCGSKDLCLFLRSRCDVKNRLPLFPNVTLFREFVAGLMDTDGWIAESILPYGSRWSIGFATTSLWHDSFKRLLQHYGVKVGKTLIKNCDKNPNWKPLYSVTFNKDSFVDAGFYFSIQRKCERLQNWQRYAYGEISETRSQGPAIS